MISARSKIFLLTLFTFTLVGLAFYGCGGDGGGGFSASSITFTPDGPGGKGDIWLELESAEPSKNRFKLKVIGDGIEGAYGVAGRLEFDRNICALGGAKSGDALEGGSAEIVAAAGSNEEGGVFGFSRSKNYESSSNLSADEVIGYLEFTVSAAGTTELSFVSKRSKVLNHKLDIVDVKNWLGGTLTVK